MKRLHDYLISNGGPGGKGWSEAQTAGILGAASYESADTTRQYNPDGGGMGAHGIFQLRGSRLTAYIKKYGHLPEQGTPEEQAEFFNIEAATTEQAGVARLMQPGMTPDWYGSAMGDFERAGGGDPVKDRQTRAIYGSRAGVYYNAYGDASNPATGALGDIYKSGGYVGQTGIAAGDQAQKALEALTNGSIGNGLIAMDAGIVAATEALKTFSAAVDGAVKSFNSPDRSQLPPYTPAGPMNNNQSRWTNPPQR
jgi:hypothetical protein